jgi:molybdate/tungstate transport system substrate-binding protein
MITVKWLLVAAAALSISIGACSCQKKDADSMKEELIIFHAGSLSVPFREISALFNKEYPHIAVKAEAAGSRNCARKICDLDRQCDIMASADYKVVANLLMPEYADFNIRFALNEMAIAYTDESGFSDGINSGNWHEILLREEVEFGRSDANLDPCGYRTLMVFQLAEKHYRIPELAKRLEKKDRHIRPKETDLLALLEAGEIDYVFIYRSVAAQHGLKMVLLPDEINLKSPRMASMYNTASVKITGKKVGEVITRTGEPMVYSVTICKDAPNGTAAADWVGLLLSARGMAIMESNGQKCIRPPIANGFDMLPQKIKPLCEPAALVFSRK